MTRAEIIKAAREACDPDKVDAWQNGFWTLTQEELGRFAAIIAAAEREVCAKVCEAQCDLREEAKAALRVADKLKNGDEHEMLMALRHDSDVRLYHTGIDKCAAAIRARSKT